MEQIPKNLLDTKDNVNVDDSESEKIISEEEQSQSTSDWYEKDDYQEEINPITSRIREID